MGYPTYIMTIDQFRAHEEAEMKRIDDEIEEKFVSSMGKLLKTFGVTDTEVVKKFLHTDNYVIKTDIFDGKEALSDSLDEHRASQGALQ